MSIEKKCNFCGRASLKKCNCKTEKIDVVKVLSCIVYLKLAIKKDFGKLGDCKLTIFGIEL